MKILRATITVTLTVNFDEPAKGGSWQDAAVTALNEAIARDHEGVIGEIHRATVDAIEVLLTEEAISLPPPPLLPHVVKTCRQCQSAVLEGERACPHCGAEQT
jgi:hypothetical protein